MESNTNLFSQLSQGLKQVEEVRDDLADMLFALSNDALEYVCRPIMYAYYWTDKRDKGRLTDEDHDRLCLIKAAARGTVEEVAALADWDRGHSQRRTTQQRG